MRKTKRRSLRARLLVAFGVAIVLGALSLAGLGNGVFGGYRLQLSDTLFPSGTADPRVKIVAIDQASVNKFAWPWPRNIHARLIRQLRKLGAQTIVFDVLFNPGAAHDDELARVEKERDDVILASQAEVAPPVAGGPLRAKELTEPVPPLARSATAIGHANVTPNSDGVVRRAPLLLETENGDLVPSLSLATLMHVEKIDPVFTFRPKGLQVADRFIPTDRSSILSLNFAPQLRQDDPSAPVFSAVKVLNDDVPRSKIKGGIVLIGVTDPSLGDDRATPVAKATEMPGVLIHANALNTMLTGGYIESVGDARIAMSAVILALIVGLLMLLAPVWLGPIGLIAVIAGYTVYTFIQFDSGRLFDLLYPMLAAVIAFVAALGVRYFTELRGRRRASALFSQYVPKPVAYQLLDEGRIEETVHGERVELTVLFCDLRGFTATSVQMAPARVRDLLNVYYDETTKLVHEHGGTLLNFVGDEVFAVWGAPMPDPLNASKAVACARGFQDASTEINRRLTEAELPPVTYGIGLHTGEVIAAHVGTEMRRQYTVLGDTVNVGSRLCTIAGRNEIVVSQDTYNQLDPKPPAEVLPGIRLKGVGRELLPHRLWPDELKDPTGEIRGKLEA